MWSIYKVGSGWGRWAVLGPVSTPSSNTCSRWALDDWCFNRTIEMMSGALINARNLVMSNNGCARSQRNTNNTVFWSCFKWCCILKLDINSRLCQTKCHFKCSKHVLMNQEFKMLFSLLYKYDSQRICSCFRVLYCLGTQMTSNCSTNHTNPLNITWDEGKTSF